MTKSVTANCMGVGSTRSVRKTELLRLQLHTTPSDGSLLWFPHIYTNYMFSKIEERLNICIIKSSQRDILGKTGGDFPEDTSHQIGIVIKS